MFLSPSNIVGTAIVAVVGFVGAAAVIPTAQQPFMTVHDMAWVNGEVVTTRTIHREVIADWRVTVVSADTDAPSCQTVPGQNLHEGWSKYPKSARGVSTWTLDVWVGDPGCEERLEAGEHYMFVTWTPREDSPPVTTKTTFTVE